MSVNKSRRPARGTRCEKCIRRIRASLFIFFEWAVLAKRAMINPVQRKVAVPQPKIEHYAPEVLRHICQFIVDPNADPTAALLLYFIVFHLTTAHELRHLCIPTAISLDSKRISTTLSASRFLLLPKRQNTFRAGGSEPCHK